MPAVWVRSGSNLGSRWGAWLAPGPLRALVASVFLPALAGPRRTGRAYPAFVAATRQADVLVWDTTPNAQIPTVNPAAVEALPQVAQAGHLRAADTFGDQGLGNGFNALGSPNGDAYMPGVGLNQAHVLSGRPFRAGSRDEAMLDFGLAERLHVHAGSWLTVRFPRPAAGMPPSIPDNNATPIPFTFQIVAIVATPGQFPPESGFYFSGPGVYVTPAFLRAHTEDLSFFAANVIT